MLALTREVPRSIADGERTHVPRTPIDLARARAEHGRYLAALEELGCEVRPLPEEPDLPDSVFVEDTAIVLDEVAVIARPGADSRRAETSSVAEALSGLRPLVTIAEPATLDGGDVLVLGRRVFVGGSSRTDAAGATALATLVEPFGYTVEVVPLTDCLHLKSAACAVGPDTVLVNPAWVDPSLLAVERVIEVDPREAFAANAVLVRDAVIHPEGFPRTRARLEAAGIRVVSVPAAELARAEGGVTCCSLLLRRS